MGTCKAEEPGAKKYPKDREFQQKHAAISVHKKSYFNLEIQTAVFSPLVQS